MNTLQNGVKGAGRLVGRAASAVSTGLTRLWIKVGAQPRLKAALAALLFGTLAAWLALAGMERSLAGRPEYQMRLDSVAWDPVPEWASAGAVEALNRAVTDDGREASASVFDDKLVGRVGRRLEKVPYLHKVESVRLDPAGGLSICVQWREPFLFVQSAGGALLDRTGEAMPREGILPGKVSVPTLTGLRYSGAGVPRPSEHAALAGVFEALALYEKEGLAGVSGAMRIEGAHLASEAERRAGRPELALRTRGGIALRLSITPGTGRPHLAEQIAALREVLRADPSLRDVREYVDVRFAEPVCR